MKLGHMEIFVKNPIEAKDFYIDVLGFELIEIQNEKVVWLKKGEREILLRPGENKLKAGRYQDTNMAFVLFTDNLDDSVNELKAKGLQFKGTDGSERCLTFTDNDGNWFQLVNPAEH
jgi:catechol 2,3-dioxygenase-like lactoylglutathione lyase family enzyme